MGLYKRPKTLTSVTCQVKEVFLSGNIYLKAKYIYKCKDIYGLLIITEKRGNKINVQESDYIKWYVQNNFQLIQYECISLSLVFSETLLR